MSLTKEQIQEWKNEYEDIYKITIGDRDDELSIEFIFRKIGKNEYNELLKKELEIGVLEEEVCKLCTLYPEYDFSNGLGGIAHTLSNAIISTSHLLEGAAEDLLIKYRKEMELFDYQMDCIIHEVFPEFSFEEISRWPIDKTIYYYSRAEWVLQHLRMIPINTMFESNQQEQNFQYSFSSEEKQQLANEQPKDGQLSEEEVLRMLQEKEAEQGRAMSLEYSSPEEMYPELNWFKHEDELRGELD